MPEPGIFSRMTWSKRGISFYDETGSFLFRLEGWMIGVMNQTILTGLARIEKERIRRETYHATHQEQVQGGGVGEHPQGDPGGATTEAGSRDSAGRAEASVLPEDEETLGVPV